MLQEVFVAAHTAMLADNRPINARPWLYRIARNRCLNHLRRPTAEGAGLDGHPPARERHHHAGAGAEARGAAGDRLRHARAPRDPAHGAGPARDRRALLHGDRAGDGHHAAGREVAAGPRADVARRGERGAHPDLRRGPARARRGGRGPAQGLGPGSPSRSRLRVLQPLPRPASLEHQGARRRWRRSDFWCCCGS